MKYKGWIKGLSVTLSFIGTLLLVLEIGASSSPSYKSLVDGIFGINYQAETSNNAETYTYLSAFKNTTELLTKRAEIAEQLEEEGIVMLKNNNSTLPLRKTENQELNVTVLGSRAFTFKNNDTRMGLRDVIGTSNVYNVYAGIVGSRTYGGTPTLSSGTVNLPITLLDALGHQNINVNPSSEQVYANKNFPMYPAGTEADGARAEKFSVHEPRVNISDFSQTDVYNDAAIVMIGRMSGEGRGYLPGERGIADITDGSKSALNLSDDERELITVAKAISDNVIVLINSAIPMEIDELKDDDRVSSILWIGLPGLYGMDGVAKIISGAANPSGHLPDVYAVDASSSPAAQNYDCYSQNNEPFTWSNPGDATAAENSNYVVLAEGIYDGYYYYETRYHDTVFNYGNASNVKGAGRGRTSEAWKYEDEVSYPFGYGLSYTTFDMEIVNQGDKQYSIDPETLDIKVDVKVTNTGSVSGKKAVQLYLSSPFTDYDVTNKIEKSAVQLMGFEKTKLLNPGEDETVTISVPLKYIASYSESVSHDSLTGGYILEDADYYFALGNNSHAALNNIIVKKDSSKSSLIYSEIGDNADSNLVFSINPSLETNITNKDRGNFVNGINATLLNKNKEGYYISNRIQNANYNFYKPNSITYLSRTNWSGTFPIAYPGLEIVGDMAYLLGKGRTNRGHVYEFTTGPIDEVWGVDHSLEEDEQGNPLPQLNIAEMKNATFEDERWDYLLEQIPFEDAMNFVPDGGNRCNSLKTINSPEVWQIDGPNGNVNKGLGDRASRSGPTAIAKNDPNYSYFTCDMPCEPIVAATFNKELVQAEGESFGEVSLWDGSKICWAPGMNLHRTPFNSRNHEYYSEDPMLTNILGAAFVKGGLSKGALLSAKHFAFNTQESLRLGLSQFLTEQSGRELELRGFQGLFEDINFVTPGGNTVNALGIMSSFSRLGVTGVNGHTGLMVNILREEMGFKGLISTDFVNNGIYFNPQDCVVNNVTFMACDHSGSILTNEWKDYANKAKNDPNIHKGLKKIMHYYLYAVSNSSALNGFDADTKAIDSASIVSPWQVGFIVGAIISLVAAGGGFAFYVLLHYKKKKEVIENVEGGSK